MERREFAEKLRAVLKKLGECSGTDYDYLVVSEDPDCIADFGVDDNGRLVIYEESTFLYVSELKCIKYRPNVDEFEDTEGYVQFEFNNDIRLCVDLPHIYETEESYYLFYKGKGFDDRNVWDIITAVNKGWDGENDFVVTNDGTLLAYLGQEKDVVIPEGVVRIAELAFGRNKSIETIVLSDTVKVIDADAFICTHKLHSVDLKNVEVIGDKVFARSNLTNITLPVTLKKLGSNAFRNSNICMKDQINNQSDVEITDEMFSWYKAET